MPATPVTATDHTFGEYLRTRAIHNLSTIPADSNTMRSLQEMVDSTEPGSIRVIHGATIFLTDTEVDASEAATLGPDDFDHDLIAWRDYLRARVAEGKV